MKANRVQFCPSVTLILPGYSSSKDSLTTAISKASISDVRVKSGRLAHGSETGTWVPRARLGGSSLLNTCFDQGAVWSWT